MSAAYYCITCDLDFYSTPEFYDHLRDAHGMGKEEHEFNVRTVSRAVTYRVACQKVEFLQTVVSRVVVKEVKE